MPSSKAEGSSEPAQQAITIQERPSRFRAAVLVLLALQRLRGGKPLVCQPAGHAAPLLHVALGSAAFVLLDMFLDTDLFDSFALSCVFQLAQSLYLPCRRAQSLCQLHREECIAAAHHTLGQKRLNKQEGARGIFSPSCSCQHTPAALAHIGLVLLL